MDIHDEAKANGAYYTPDAVVRSLVSWAVRDETDAMLEPSCGDGRFLMGHVNAVGVEQEPRAAADRATVRFDSTATTTDSLADNQPGKNKGGRNGLNQSSQRPGPANLAVAAGHQG